jgi:predicted AAA+ superfamily ATPase
MRWELEMELIRESYLKKIRPFYGNDLVKAVVGIRRSGKSILLSQIKKEIISSGVKEDHIIEIDLEQVSLLFYDIKYIDNFISKLIIDKDKYYIF